MAVLVRQVSILLNNLLNNARIIIICSLLIPIFQINGLTLFEKINIQKQLSTMNTELYNNNFNAAKLILLEIKKNYIGSEFNIIANYYLSLIEYTNENYFPSTHFIELALANIEDKRLTNNFKNNIITLAGILYYQIGLTDNALLYLEKTRIIKNSININRANLYLSYIYFQKNNLDKAKFYYYEITTNLLNKKETDLYLYLNNYIGWKKIDTKTIGYKDPNISCLYTENDLVYIGLWHGGLIVYNYILDTHRFIASPALVSDEIRAIYGTETHIWVGTSNGISLINKRDDTISQLDYFNNYKITDIKPSGSDVIISTLGHGLIRYNLKNNSYNQIVHNKNISTTFVDDTIVLIATYDGALYSYKNNYLKEIHYNKYSKKPITSIAKNKTHFCFATYGNGIITSNFDFNTFTVYNSQSLNTIKNDYFLTISEKDNSFYCGSLGNGIYCLNNEIISMFKVSDYYIGNDIQQIQFQNNYMFIATLGEGVLIRMIQ